MIPWKLFESTSTAKKEERPLDPEDLEPLPGIEQCTYAKPEFESKWLEALNDGKETSLTKLIIRNYKRELFLGAFLRLLSDLANVGLSLILRQIILYLEDHHDEPSYSGYLYCVALALANILSIMGLSGSNEVTNGMFQRVRSAVTCMVFEKSLRLYSDHGQQGAIVAMHSTDTAKFRELMFLHGLVVAPIALIANMVAMYIFIGWPGLISLVALIILLIIQSFFSSKTGGVIHEAHIHADARLKAITEAIMGIRICKFMNWEDKVAERIAKIRAKEVEELKTLYSYRGVITAISHSMHMLLLMAVFGIAYAAGEGISASAVFPAMSLLNSLRHVVNGIAMGLGKVLDMVVSLRRLEEFFLQPEKGANLLPIEDKKKELEEELGGDQDDEKKKKALQEELEDIDNTAFTMTNITAGFNVAKEFTPILKDVSVTIPKKKLTIVAGATGSGKSTLVNALIGECRLTEDSKIFCSGNVAYVAQEAWIMNATVKNNILMGLPYDEEKYVQATTACQLIADFDQLAEGDATEIGERGINLSGGQKQRIAFARAVYSGKEIIVMDDPLAAVDSHVCRALFEDCIAGEALDGKTRVLVTHQTQFLPFADRIIAMKDRKINFCGSYDDLVANPEASQIVLGGNMASPAHMSSGARSAGSARSLTPGGRNKRDEEEDTENLASSPAAAASAAKKNTGKLIAEEDQGVGSIGADVYKWIFGLAGTSNVALCFLVFTLWRVSLLFVDIFLGMWSKDIGGFGKDEYTDLEYFQWFGITTLIGLVFVSLRQVIFNHCLNRVASNTHDAMVERLLRAPISFFDTTPVGRMLNRFSKDMRVIDMIVSEFTVFVMSLVFLSFGYIIIIVVSAVYMLVLVGLLSVLYYRLQQWYTFTLRAVKRVENVERSPMMAIMSESLGGIVTIRAYGLQNMVSNTHSSRVDGMMRALYNNRAANVTIMAIVAMMGSVIILCTSILSVVFVTSSDAAAVSPGDNLVTLGLTYSTVLTTVFGFLLILSAEVDASMSAAERMKTYATDIPQEKVVVYGSGNNPDEEYPPPPKNWPNSGKITFEDVSLRYRDGLPLVLKDISIEIQDGEKVGIVGRTGSGKSTVMLALFRMVELAGGRLHIDSFDISGLDLGDLRSKITIIPQDPVLFQGTVRSNLDPFGKFEEKDLLNVVKKVGIQDRIEEEGLDTPVSDKGSNFSVGQRQLLCLGRAILKKCRVLLLDEATASVDFESDAMIQNTIRNEFKHCTVLTIAHRLATVIDNDKILVLDEGSVAEFNHPKVLLDNMDGSFFSMVSNLGEEQYLEMYNAANAAYVKKGLHLQKE